MDHNDICTGHQSCRGNIPANCQESATDVSTAPSPSLQRKLQTGNQDLKIFLSYEQNIHVSLRINLHQLSETGPASRVLCKL